MAAVTVIVILVIVNLAVFLSKPPSIYCYKDVCIMGKEDALQEIKDLLSSSNKAAIVVEGDIETAQKNTYISQALVTLSKDVRIFDKTLVGIKFENGQPIECICSRIVNTDVLNCSGNSTSYCETLTPDNDGVMIKLFYPSYSKNQIIIDNRTIKFEAKSGQDALAMVQFFEQLFVK